MHFFLHQFHQQQLSKRSRNKINKVIVTQLNPLLFIMKQTSSHTSHFKYSRKEKDRLQVIKRSDSPAKIDTITNIKQQEEQFLPRDIEYQLQLNIQKYSYEVKDQIRYLLMELLRYPSIKMAIRHSYANRLGYHDLKHIKNKYNEQSTYLSSRYRPDHCEDCNLILQQRQVPMCSSIWQYPKAGLATYLLFRNMKVIMMMLFFLGALFTIVSLYINIKVIQILVSAGTSITLTLDFSSFGILISNGLKVTYSSSSSTISLLFYLQAILLILVLLVWWFSKYVVECVSQKYARIVDQASLTAADFSIMLENVPIHYSKQSLQAQFDRYFESLLFGHNIKNTWGEVIHPFTIRKICQTIPFSLNQSDVLDKQLQGLDHDIFQKKKLFAQWVQQIKVNSRFTFTRTQRQRQYLIFEKMLERRQAKLEEMEQRARQQYKRANKNMTSTVFVTFYHNQSAEIIENLNPQNLPAKIRYYLSCKKSTQYFDIRDFKVNNQADIVASRAPQPEDIIWGNVAVPLKVLFVRKLLVWLAMMVLSGICLVIVIGLSFAQIGGNTFWPAILIGLFITIFNILTKFVLRKISPYEKDITQTERQRGILLKSLFVMAFNWIVPLVATNIGTQKNFYSTNGYAQQVFWIGLFEAIIPPIIRIFDPEHLVKIILKCWKARPYNKIILKQSELNSYLQRQQYELGYSYIYFFNILFLNAFYVNMQPAIVIAALIGTFMMYWAQKYCLINRSHRPEKSAKTLNETVQTLLSFTPFILWMGHIIWVNAMLKDYSSSIFSVDMALMCLSIGYFITPWKSLYACFCHIPQQEILDFQTCRSKLPTEYDRLNPATVQEGVADYIQHLQDKKKEDSNLLNRSEENLIQNFNTNLLMQQISKIPAIFGRKNQVTKKIDKSAINRPKSIKGQEIELLLVQPQNNQSLNESYISVAQSNTKNKLASGQQSPQLVQKSNQSQVFQKDNNSNEKSKPRYAQSETQSPENDKKEVMNLNSNGQTFGRKKGGLNQKRKTISVVYKQENYQYQNRSSKL